jgi:MFS transporter, Spinster family, sphingosine-1-phosphate transporter
VGGYENKNSLRLGLFMAILSGIIAVPIPFIDNFYLLAVNLWFYLYIGGLLVPLMTGIYLANVEVEYRTKSASMANMFYEAFGFAPAPYIWGLVQNATGGKHSRWGLGSTVLMNFPPVIFLLIAVLV